MAFVKTVSAALYLLIGALVGLALVSAPLYADNMMSATSPDSQSTTDSSDSISYEGNITQITPNGFTIASRYADRTISVVTASYTTYVRQARLRPRDLQVGEQLAINGDADATVKSLFIQVAYVQQNNLAPNSLDTNTDKKVYPILATVSALTPDVMVQTPDNNSYTLRLRNMAQIIEREPGSGDDIEIGRLVRVTGLCTGSLDNEVLNASHVELIALEGQKFKQTVPTTPSISAAVTNPTMAPAN